PAGNTLAQYTYDPYGNMTMTGGSSNPYQFTGHENDGTGLYHFGRRYYDPVFARFLNEGSFARITRGVNPYDYINNDPVSPDGAGAPMDPDPSPSGVSTARSCGGSAGPPDPGLRLRPESDCSIKGQREILYELSGPGPGDWWITEHQQPPGWAPQAQG